MSKFFNFKIALPVAISVIGSGSALAALNCTTQPTCEQLGYSKSVDANCEDYILCPFDTSYKKCITGKVDCTGLGFTQEDKSGWCGNVITCPTDASYTLCAEAFENPCPNGYDSRLSSVADCGSQGANGWTFSSQTITGNNGEDIVCGKCTAKTCSRYYASYQSVDDCGRSGSNGWKFASCYAGEELRGKCTAKTCSSYGYMDSQKDDYLCKKTSSLYKGDYKSICYDCVSCSSAGLSGYSYLYIGNASCLTVCAEYTSSSKKLYGSILQSFSKNGRSGKCYVWILYNPDVVSPYSHCCCKSGSFISDSPSACYRGY